MWREHTSSSKHVKLEMPLRYPIWGCQGGDCISKMGVRLRSRDTRLVFFRDGTVVKPRGWLRSQRKGARVRRRQRSRAENRGAPTLQGQVNEKESVNVRLARLEKEGVVSWK